MPLLLLQILPSGLTWANPNQLSLKLNQTQNQLNQLSQLKYQTQPTPL